MEWISAVSEVHRRWSPSSWTVAAEAWYAWPISWVNTRASPAVPLKLAKMKGTPMEGRNEQKPPAPLPSRAARSRSPSARIRSKSSPSCVPAVRSKSPEHLRGAVLHPRRVAPRRGEAPGPWTPSSKTARPEPESAGLSGSDRRHERDPVPPDGGAELRDLGRPVVGPAHPVVGELGEDARPSFSEIRWRTFTRSSNCRSRASRSPANQPQRAAAAARRVSDPGW